MPLNCFILNDNSYYPFGMIMPGRSSNPDDYRFGFNGYEKDDEVSGSGNAYDFNGYGYDSRLARRKNIDPMTSTFTDDSPYSFSGGNPVLMVDVNGNKKTYYLTIIKKDGTKTQLQVIEKYKVIKKVTETRETVGFRGVTFYTSPKITNTKTYDLAQEITLDENTGEITYGKEYETSERSNVSAVRFVEDNAEQAIEELAEYSGGTGGIVFTSEIGQGGETRVGSNADSQVENIDLLTAVVGAANSAATNKQAVNFLKSFKQAIDAMTIGSDVKEQIIDKIGNNKKQSTKPDSTYCGSCKENVSTNDTSDHILVPKE